MAKTQGERLDELAKKVEDLTRKHDRLADLVEIQVKNLTEGLMGVQAVVKDLTKEQKQSEKEYQQTTAKYSERISALEATSRVLEKLSDRSWGLAQAILISVLSLLCGAIVTLLVQFLPKK